MKRVKVLYIAAECKPFSKVGGVGDVAGELPPAIKAEGIEIEIATPQYSSVADRHIGDEVYAYKVRFSGRDHDVAVHRGDLQGVPVFFIKSSTYFEGKYGKPYIVSRPTPFKDDILRFSFFSEACLELIKWREPDIVHINDWPLGYLFARMKMEGLRQRRVLTVHNVGYQGNIWVPNIDGMDIENILRHETIGNLFRDPREEWNSVNALRLALELSDMANTVSNTYCEEMTEQEDRSRFFEGGKGLHAIAKRLRNKGRLIGIVNGFKYRENDTKFPDVLKQKASAKRQLGKTFGFEEPDRVLLGFVGRAAEQKFRLLTENLHGASVLEHLLDLPVNIAILATGQPEYESFISSISMHRFPGALTYDQLTDAENFLGQIYRRGNYGFVIAFDKEMAGLISLGSDIFLMPSLFEPCGITQMESLSNATPPLVRRTGGLADTVIPHDQEDGTGFVFSGKDRNDLLFNFITCVRSAAKFYDENKEEFERIQERGFGVRFTWPDAARKYKEQLYHVAMGNAPK